MPGARETVAFTPQRPNARLTRRETGELGQRLPLHPEYFELTKGQYADLTNVAEERKAMSFYAAEFLRQFVDDRPWVHMDIAGTAWGLGRPYEARASGR